MSALAAGKHFLRGEDGYESARRATVWNGLLPERFPDVIVQAFDADDVVAAIRYAKHHGHQVGVRSGGHSWAANHLRDGGLLLDVSRLEDARIDSERMTAVVGPGKDGAALADELDAHGLFFPVGHCRGVKIGGFLLQGGYGWYGRTLGMACESVLGLEVVTADGEKIFCDAEHHPDLYWAARGSGTGFFGVVTAFHLKLHPRPPVCGISLQIYPADLSDEIYSWARGTELDRRMEMLVVASRELPVFGIDSPSILLFAPVFADSEKEAADVLAVLEAAPMRDRATLAVPYTPATLASCYDAVMSNYPTGHRYATDNMWTSASAAELLPGIRRILETMPPYPAHFLWGNWGPAPARPDMAYGLEDDIYMALYSVWPNPDDDEKYSDWPRSNMAEMAHLASGVQLADENLGQRPAKFTSDENMARLDQVRASYDPDGRFHSWMGRL